MKTRRGGSVLKGLGSLNSNRCSLRDGLSFGLGLGLCGGGLSCNWCLILCYLSCGGGLSLSSVRGRPEGQVVAEQLHDQGAVAVGLLGERIKLSNSVIECLLGKVARAIRRVQDLIIEDGEIEGEA